MPQQQHHEHYQYNTNLYGTQRRMRIRGAAWQWTCYVLQLAENSEVFKQDLKQASEGADRKSGIEWELLLELTHTHRLSIGFCSSSD